MRKEATYQWGQARQRLGWGVVCLLLLTGGAWALSWQLTVVDQGAASYVSLALDQQRLPHISRFNSGTQVLTYSRFDGQVWRTAVVDGGIPNFAGASSALALDRQNRPHVSYDALQGLRYARFDGTAWHIETVEPQRSGFTSLALDALERPHISYCDCANGILKYAHFDGTAWDLERVEVRTNPPQVGATSLKLDRQDRPHIAYSGFQQLRYAHFNGITWQIETADDLGPFGLVERPSLVLDGESRPHIAYTSTGGMKYAHRDGNAWRREVIPTGGGDVSLTLDRTGHPLISFYFVDAINQVFAVKLARFDRLAWQVETVDTEVNGKTALALDAEGYVHIGYSSFNPDSLKYARGLPPPLRP